MDNEKDTDPQRVEESERPAIVERKDSERE
jgi:hypothetical protein